MAKSPDKPRKLDTLGIRKCHNLSRIRVYINWDLSKGKKYDQIYCFSCDLIPEIPSSLDSVLQIIELLRILQKNTYKQKKKN